MSSKARVGYFLDGKLLSVVASIAVATWLSSGTPVLAQRRLGIDISAFQNNITASNWTTLHTTNSRDFAFIRSSRGGTTGFDHLSTDNILNTNADCNGVSTRECLSLRYDDPYFGQNMTRATNEGLFTAPYHRQQSQVIASTPNSGGIANTGTDEAEHMMQMASAWMRPGYLPPVLDFEDGINEHTDQELAQFALDFSNRIYAVMQIRPAIYINGNYAANVIGGGTTTQRSQIAQQSSDQPSLESPAFYNLWTARWPNQTNPNLIDVQNSNPKDAIDINTGTGTPTVYGAWDDYGVSQPWAFWQYSSTARLSGYNNGNSNIDVDVSQGDIEFVKDQLVPAIWWDDISGDWSTLTKWNSGQPLRTYNMNRTFAEQQVPVPPNQANPAPYMPPVFPNMTPVQGSTTLPTPRLPGGAGSGPTAGSNDTVLLDRPNADITVALSVGTHNIRKMYMRETLNISGGTLTINYDPKYYLIADPDYATSPDYPNALHSGPISAQFSGAVTLSGAGSLSVHTLQVDATQTFMLTGSTGSLTFNTISLMPHSTTPGNILVTGDVNINPLNHSNPHHTLTATIANGVGSGSSGLIDLGGGTRAFNVGNVSADVDLDVAVPITNGGLTKNGVGTMRLSGNNTFSGSVTVNAGVLRYNHASGLNAASLVTVNNGGTLDMNNISDTVAGLSGTGGAVTQGTAGLTLSAASGTNSYSGTINGTGVFVKSGTSAQILSGNNSLGPVNLNAGSLLFNGTNTTGTVSVNGGTIGGTGSITGAVIVNNAAHLAPGTSIESLDMGALTLNSGSVLDFELGALGVGDQIKVTGALTLNGGSVNLFDTGSMSEGTYTLIHYGALINSVANLGTPTGPASFVYQLVDTGTRINLVVSEPGVPGDYNNNGTVDAADYVLWRKGGLLANEVDAPGTVNGADYTAWRARFGNSSGSGSGSDNSTNTSVPEPATNVLLMFAATGWCLRQRRKSHQLIYA